MPTTVNNGKLVLDDVDSARLRNPATYLFCVIVVQEAGHGSHGQDLAAASLQSM